MCLGSLLSRVNIAICIFCTLDAVSIRFLPNLSLCHRNSNCQHNLSHATELWYCFLNRNHIKPICIAFYGVNFEIKKEFKRQENIDIRIQMKRKSIWFNCQYFILYDNLQKTFVIWWEVRENRDRNKYPTLF